MKNKKKNHTRGTINLKKNQVNLNEYLNLI
jgi:hypothetical protein